MKTVSLTFSDRKYADLIENLEALQKSCEEALSGSWNKSDEGFEAMLLTLKEVRHELEATRLKTEF